MGFSIGVAFVMISLFINNSVAKHQVGAVNGLAVSLTALTRKVAVIHKAKVNLLNDSFIIRTFAPSFGGSIFAWCISWGAIHIGFPFDNHFAFYLFSIVYLLSLLLSVNLPNSLERQKLE